MVYINMVPPKASVYYVLCMSQFTLCPSSLPWATLYYCLGVGTWTVLLMHARKCATAISVIYYSRLNKTFAKYSKFCSKVGKLQTGFLNKAFDWIISIHGLIGALFTNWLLNFNFDIRNELANFGTKFGIFWQKFCEINCKDCEII